MDVWATFRDHFDTNDGTLPEVQLHGLDGAGVVAVCRKLVEMGTVDAGFHGAWDTKEERQREDLTFLEAVQGVVEWRLECFHWSISHIRVGDVELPQLGVFVFDDSVYLDYRMGTEWTPATVPAFLELLELLLSLSPSARLVADQTVPYPEEFMKSWHAFHLERSSNNLRTS